MGSEDLGARLAQLVDEDPYDVERYRVLADWLGDQGDPRSQLTAMHIVQERLTDKAKLVHLERRIEEFFEVHRKHFLGPLDKYVATPTMSRKRRDLLRQRFTWRFGFVHTAALACEHGTRKETLDQILAHLLDHPSGRFVVALELRWPERPAALIDVLARRSRMALRSLSLLVDVNLEPLWPALPRLRALHLEQEASLGDIVLPELRVARFTANHPASNLRSIAAAEWPMIEELEIHCCGDDVAVDALVPLFERGDLAALRTLALRDAGFLAALLRAFAGSPLSQHVRTLDLHRGHGLTDAAALAFAALSPAPLEVLAIPAHELSEVGMAALRGVAKQVVVKSYSDS